MRFAAVVLFALKDRVGEIVHVTADPAEASVWVAEDRALRSEPMRVVLRVDKYGVTVA